MFRKTEPAVGARLRQLREVLAPADMRNNQTRFAAFIDIPYTTWNNYENGFPIKPRVLERVIAKFPGVTSDWVYSGRESTLSVEIAQRLASSAARREVG